MKSYVEVIILRNSKEIDRVFTYKAPKELEDKIQIGMRVLVPFGYSKKPVEGFVIGYSDKIDFPESKLKSIYSLPDKESLFSENMLELAMWMRDKYYTTLASCFKTIIPTGMNVETDYIYKVMKQEEKVSDKARKVLDYILKNENKVTFTELDEEFTSIRATLSSLEKRKIIGKTPVSKTRDYTIRLKHVSINENANTKRINSIIKEDKQQGWVLSFLQDNEIMPVNDLKKILHISDSPINTLEKYGLVNIEKIKIRRNVSMTDGEEYKKNLELTKEQLSNLDFISKELDRKDKKPILLFGVTGSGKTEVYIKTIEAVLKKGQQAIVLVPEISLTPQTVSRFTSRFKEKVSVTHSRLSLGERYDQWKKAKDGEIQIMIGPRSAIFTPFDNLGVIIMDEEHESSYVSSTTPKYSTRDVAIKLGEITNSLVIMGTATPSIDSFYNVKKNKFNILKMEKRISGQEQIVKIIDMRRELETGNRSIFGTELRETLIENVANNQQSILFLNRRGHSTFVSCRACGHVLECDNCNVNYTYHNYSKKVMCHYCGKQEDSPDNCPVCGSKYIKYFGVGTQRIEEEMKKMFPDEVILRMDLDTVSKKHSHESILTRFRKQESKILIGTQMIAKGLDFPNVTLVGIIAADVSLNNGDFRAGETTYQLLSQVSGRAGRGVEKGRVFIQTYDPDHYSIVFAKNNDYTKFYDYEISLRRQMFYPPFSNVFTIIFVSDNEKKVIQSLNTLVELMTYVNKKEKMDILGPAPCVVSKIKNKYRWKVIVKAKDEELIKQFVFYCLDKLNDSIDLGNISINATLNPVIIQ